MNEHRVTVYLDSLRAGHAYLELLQPGEEPGTGLTYGFYPARKEEKKEVLFGKGSVRKDCERLRNSRQSGDILMANKDIELTKEEYERSLRFVEKQHNRPNWYFLIGYNCIDFIQDVVRAAKGKAAPSFLELFSNEDLAELSWVGVYARLEKAIG